jgi:hypothetical protein
MAIRLLTAAALIAFVTVAAAQGTGEGRGSPIAGTAADGSRPSDGAITGGSIQPGESAGIPRDRPGVPAAERIRRCEELSGTLREDCLRKERSSGGAGSTQAPREVLPSLPSSDRADQPSR